MMKTLVGLAAIAALQNPHFNWVRTVDNWGNVSSYVASSPSNAQLFKAQILIHFSMPWKMSGKTTTKYIVGVDATTTYTVPVNRCALILGYHLEYGSGGSVAINVDDSTLELADVTTGLIKRTPGFCNGMYLEYGDHIDLVSSNHAGNLGWVRILEFDADDDVSVVFAPVSNPTPTYTVSTGKTLYVTNLITQSVGANYLQIYEGGGWVDVWDVQSEGWSLGKGVLQFPPGTVLRMDSGYAYIFGVEVKGD